MKKKAICNVQNRDNKCFLWSVLRYLHHDYIGVEFPVKTKHYSRIEAQNRVNINVFGYENKQFYPIYVSTGRHEELNLLLISEGEKQHYGLVTDRDKLLYNKTKHQHREHFCMHCLQAFSSKEVLTKHKENFLSINGKQAIQMPKKGSKVEFQDYHKQLPIPFVIYANFEVINEKVSGCQPNGEKSYTDKYQHHTACSYGYKLVCCYVDKHSKPEKIYRGEEPVNKFLHQMLEEVEYCKDTMRKHFKSDGQEISAIEWQELKNRLPSFFVHK